MTKSDTTGTRTAVTVDPDTRPPTDAAHGDTTTATLAVASTASDDKRPEAVTSDSIAISVENDEAVVPGSCATRTSPLELEP